MRNLNQRFSRREVMNKQIVLSVVSFLLFSLCSYAQSMSSDTLYVYFEKDKAHIDPAFDGNKKTLDSISGLISRYGRTPQFHISVTGAASPEGTTTFNQWLSHRRVESLVEYMEMRTGVLLSAPVLDSVGMGVDWDGLALSIERAEAFDGADEALSIIRDTPIWIVDDGKVTGGRLKSIKDLNGGRVYRYMMEHLFFYQRRVQVVLQYVPYVPPASVIKAVPTVPAVVCSMEEMPVPVPLARTASVPEYEPYYRLALKTNLLADIALMPSLELEYLINGQWSVSAQGAVAWWSNDPAHRYYQISTIYPEARWWFKTKAPWHGHYLGLFAGGTWYDLENGARGYQGEGGFVGISYGYMFPISKCLSFEAGIGLGYLYTKYREYLPMPYGDSWHYVYQQTSVLNYVGPLKLKFAFVWRFLDTNKKGGER